MKFLCNTSISRYPILLILLFTLCIPLRSSAQLTFSDEIVITGHSLHPESVYSADLDGDGDTDVLAASRDDNKIAWYENLDGLGRFGPQRIITVQASEALSVFSIDIDGDGDNDVLSASYDDDKIAWYENTDGLGDFGPQQIITTDADGARSVFSIDIDGDGDNDVLSASNLDDGIAWYENTDGLGSFGTEQIITLEANYANCVFSADLDGDGDNDVLSSSFYDDKVAWYENTDGLGSFGPQQIITIEADGARSVFSIDIDGDGDNDVISASQFDDKIAWYENADGLGNFGVQQIIASNADGANSVFSIDLDGDGDVDVLSASGWDDNIAWYENTDGLGSFGTEQIITLEANGAICVFSADLDGDGDNDALSASGWDDNIAWYENIDGEGDFSQQQPVSSSADGAVSVYSVDMDGDGDNDVLSASENDDKIAMYLNTDGLGNFGSQVIFTSHADGVSSILGSDLDGDNDYDILFSTYNGDRIAWIENANGAPTHNLTIDADGAESVFSADLDGDGDNDVLSASFRDDKIAWYENPENTTHVITLNANGARSVFGADLDGDGDVDVLSASGWDDKIAWYENTDGLGDFGPQQIITLDAYRARSVFSIDLDGDGDNDVLSASITDNLIAWYENTDGLGDFGPQQVITTNALDAESVFSIDLDGDGDNDVLSASSGDDKIAWYENIDGLGDFGPQQIITDEADGAWSVFSADLDGDGDNDVLSASKDDDKIAWYRNEGLLPPVPPQPFSLLQPDSGAVIIAQEVILEWEEAIDPNHDLSPYWIYISDNPDNLEESFYDSSSINSYTFTGEFETPYWWSILARDAENHETWANQVFNFTTIDPGAPPLPFNLLQPDSGTVFDSLEINLEWEESIDPDDNFSHYSVFVSENPDSIEEGYRGNTTLTNYAFTGINDGEYWWSIVAVDSLNNETWANQVYYFAIEFNGLPPLAFNLLQPDSGIVIDSLEAVLEWEETSDPDEDLSFYRVYFSDNLDSLEQNFVVGTTETQYNFTGNRDTIYWWTISARDDHNNITWANQVFSFTLIDGLPPLPFNLIVPDSGAVFDSLDILLEWEEVIDPNDDFSHYRVFVSDNPDSLESGYQGSRDYTTFTFTGENSNEYWWSISATDERDNITWANQVYSFTIDLNSVDNNSSSEIPERYELTSIYPNPFNPRTTITIGLPEASFLQVDVYNILGQQVANLADRDYQAGYHTFEFNGSGLAGGIYFVKANVPGQMDEVRKVVLMK